MAIRFYRNQNQEYLSSPNTYTLIWVIEFTYSNCLCDIYALKIAKHITTVALTWGGMLLEFGSARLSLSVSLFWYTVKVS